MATAEEILQTMADETGDENVIEIDSDLRRINIPAEIKILGVENDKEVRRLKFRMPAMYGEFNLADFALRINYLNAQGNGDVYVVTDALKEDDRLSFSWLVGESAAKYKGDVQFIVCAKLIGEEGEIVKEFNTTRATLKVLEGLEVDREIEENDPDLIEQILKRLDNLEKGGGGNAAGNYIPNEDGAVKRENIADLAINNAKLNYEAVSNAKIMAGTIQKDRMAADAIQYLTGGPYVSVSYDGAARADITQGKHVFALRLIDDSSRNLRTWLLNHSTYDGVYLHQGTDIEGPIKLLGRTDFVGGIHGDEQLVSMRMIADGVDITGSAADLAGVKTLSVYVTSTVNDEDGGAALFSREKVLTFSGTSLTVENRWVYTGAESVSVERWPGCGLYSVFAANSLGYTTCKTLTPSMDSLDADAAVKEVAFWVSGTRVTVQALRGMDGEHYAGFVESLSDSNRIKAYFDAIHAPEGYALNTGDVLEAAFRITIGEDAAGRINEIPGTLPNPFPLTINGTSYDGSKQVDVTVEGGIGGGSAAEGSNGFEYVDTFDLSSGALRYDLDVDDANEFLLVITETLTCAGGTVELNGVESASIKSFNLKNSGKSFLVTRLGEDRARIQVPRGDSDNLTNTIIATGENPIFSGVYLSYTSASAGKVVLYKR